MKITGRTRTGVFEHQSGSAVEVRTLGRGWLMGHPLPPADAPHQTVSKKVGLAIFGADALSSIAWSPQETLVILAAAGTQAFGYAFPISVVITALLAIVTVSYLQTIQAYPSGGGAYTVVKENLGEPAALVAGAALPTDYILPAAVTVASGVAQVVIESPDRRFLQPFLDYVNELSSALQSNERLTIVVPQFIPKRWWHNLLYTQTTFWLRFMLFNKSGVVITEVPYQID